MHYFVNRQAEYPPRNTLEKVVLALVKGLHGYQIDSPETLNSHLTQQLNDLNAIHHQCPPLELITWHWQKQRDTPMFSIKLAGVHSSTLIYWAIQPIKGELRNGVWYLWNEETQSLAHATNHL